ncbi:MAG: winged helix-turn-helix domain-containing protein, partial [Flavipsychrobacter sp.]|nr:winged helix-turn-helix domain-containing protein [Flavipsychrobacter sp.]
LRKLSQADFSINNIRNAGVKTIKELETLFAGIAAIIEQISTNNGVQEVKFDNVFEELASFVGVMPLELNEFLKEQLLKQSNHQFPVLKFFQLLIQNTDMLDSRDKFLLIKKYGIFISEKTLSSDEIATALDISKERVRQILAADALLEKIEQSFRAISMILARYGINHKTKWFNETDLVVLDESNINGIERTEFSLSFLYIFASVLNPEYVTLEIPDSECERILVKKEIISVVDLREITEVIQKVISTKIDESFEINLQGFISNYRKTPDIEEALFQRIVFATEEILVKAFSIISDTNGNILINRNTKKKVWESIFEVLQSSGNPMHVSEIAFELQRIGIKADINSVKSNMLRLDNIFVLAGPSTYGLKKWVDEGRIIGGTIKNIVEEYIRDKGEPCHIRELTNFVNRYRETSYNSIFTNIQNDPAGKFKYYGQGYYGLSKVNYPQEKTQYNQVHKQWFRRVKLEIEKQKNYKLGDLIRFVSEEFDIESIQAEHLIYQRIEAGELTLKKENIELSK